MSLVKSNKNLLVNILGFGDILFENRIVLSLWFISWGYHSLRYPTCNKLTLIVCVTPLQTSGVTTAPCITAALDYIYITCNNTSGRSERISY